MVVRVDACLTRRLATSFYTDKKDGKVKPITPKKSYQMNVKKLKKVHRRRSPRARATDELVVFVPSNATSEAQRPGDEVAQ